jgi:hypothetical protein
VISGVPKIGENKLIPRSEVLSLEKLTVAKLVKKFPSFYGTTNVVTMVTISG